MKIGIMGGTFNPVHNGHLAIATAALSQQHLDKVWFMPSGLPAYKANDELLPAKIRYHLVQLAIQKNPDFESVSFEIDRNGPTYTADTMTALKAIYPENEFYFIVGADSLMKFQNWVQPEVISSCTTLLAAGRDDYSREELLAHSNYLKQQFGTNVLWIDTPKLDVSSSSIRNLCRNEEYAAVRELLPEDVVQYIMENQLWKYPKN